MEKARKLCFYGKLNFISYNKIIYTSLTEDKTMSLRRKVGAMMKAVDDKFMSQFGFHVRDTSFSKLVDYMHEPKNSSSLAVTRILFGLTMLFDIPSERGGANMESRWGGTNICHFPLLSFLQPISMPYMAIVYAGLWFGAIGIMLGYKYRISATLFTACYWYLFLIEKSFWNNHSYLFGLVALLLTCTDANCYWSIDAYLNPSKLKTSVPYWNYFILKYQFFILYFMAGLKKGTVEWLTGYSVQNLSEHWVFGPFKLFLTVPQIDYLIVHWFIFIFDLTVSMWMMYARSRHVAMIFCSLFHLMNSRLFSIGMFPWVCLATMPLFYPFDWPKVMLRKFQFYHIKIKGRICTRINLFAEKGCECKSTAEEKDDADCVSNFKFDDTRIKGNKTKGSINDDIKEKIKINEKKTDDFDEDDNDKDNFQKTKMNNEDKPKGKNATEVNSKLNNNRKKLTLCLIMLHVLTQAFLPYSHFITKGYNNWTNGLYGYSWDMMVHTWETQAIVVRVVDNENQAVFYVDPYINTPNDRWTRHNDMVHQYARCLRDKLLDKEKAVGQSWKLSQNLSIYVDVWCSMNGRFTQRHFDSETDMLKVDWSPFMTSSYLMPLLDEASDWREKLDTIRDSVHTWSNNSDVVFIADFPGYVQEKYISTDIRNVTLTVLQGEVVYEPEATNFQNGYSYKLSTGAYIPVHTGTIFKVWNVGEKPAYYMFTFYNSTEVVTKHSGKPKLPIFMELFHILIQMIVFIQLMLTNLGNIFLCLSKCKK